MPELRNDETVPVEPPQEKSRANHTVRDLVWTMLVVGAFVAFIYLMVLRPTPDPIREVDVPSAALVAKSAETFPIFVPEVTEDWRSTSARYTVGDDPDEGQWYNGYINPDGQFVAVAQQNYAIKDFISEITDSGVEQGQETINGQQWTVVLGQDGEYSLIQQTPDVTTIVTGTVPTDQLVQFAASLQAV